jgi:hypothetical protein
MLGSLEILVFCSFIVLVKTRYSGLPNRRGPTNLRTRECLFDLRELAERHRKVEAHFFKHIPSESAI